MNRENGKLFMQDYNFNAVGTVLTLLAGSIGYLQQVYLIAENKDVMRFISYAATSYIIESLKPMNTNKIVDSGFRLAGAITWLAGIDTINEFDRMRYAKKVFRHNGYRLTSLMWASEALYVPYSYLGKAYRYLKKI
jgi:hypothetical protein